MPITRANVGLTIGPRTPAGKQTNAEEEDGEVKDGKDTRSQPPTAPTKPNPRDSLPARPTGPSGRDTPKRDITPASGPGRSGTPTTGANANTNGPRTDPRPNSLPDRPPHTLPSRPDVPIPSHFGGPERFGQPRGHERREGREPRDPRQRDPREPRDTRETREAREPRDGRENRDHRDQRDQREARPVETGRLERPREYQDRRGSESSREQPRADAPSRRNEHERERGSRESRGGRQHEQGRLNDSPAPAPAAATPTAPAKPAAADAPEPPMNPERAALFAKDGSERTERPERAERTERPERSERSRGHESERHGRNRRSGVDESMDIVNPERAALIQDTNTPTRPSRDETRERGPRTHSPRRSGRYGHENGPPDAAREEKQDRPYPPEHRSSGRDPKEQSPMPGAFRGERPAGRENEKGSGHKGRDTSSVREQPARAPEPEFKAPPPPPPHQDHSYGRLNSAKNVNVPDAIPSGPRGRGRGAARGSHGGPQAIPGRLDNRFGGQEVERPPTPDRPPPTGPSSGRGRRNQFEQNSAPATPSGAPGNSHPERMRNLGSGANMGSPAASVNATPIGVHPERMNHINKTLPPPPPPPPGPPPHGHGRHSMPQMTIPDRPSGPSGPSGPRQTPGSYSGSPATEGGVPTGPASSNERSRAGGSRRQLAGINNTLQQAQANMPDLTRSSSGRRSQPRQMLGNSDIQVLTGGSPVQTPVQERQDPMRHESSSRVPQNGEEAAPARGEHDRSRRDRESRSNRPSRRSSRDRERDRSPGREREGKEHREHRERRSDAGPDGSSREERGSRRSGREPSSSNREPMGPPPTGRDLMQGREGRYRGDGQGGRAGNEEWTANNQQGGRPGRGEGRSRPEDQQRREDRGRKRRSEDGAGNISNDRGEKRPRR